MWFAYAFIKNFFIGIWLALPILVVLLLGIALQGMIIGRREGWSRLDTIYYSFITATTVGYGDFRPRRRICKLLSISIAFLGLIYTGIVVSLALHAGSMAFADSGRGGGATAMLQTPSPGAYAAQYVR